MIQSDGMAKERSTICLTIVDEEIIYSYFFVDILLCGKGVESTKLRG